jgi:pyrroloquinoline quinone (PQQ) biosynthesis protein C
MAQPVTQWATVTGDTVIIARDSGEVWFQSFEGMNGKGLGGGLPFAKPMACKGAPGSTVGLLDGAIRLGFERGGVRPTNRRPNLIRYIYGLIGAYYTSKDTPRNLLRAAERFKEISRPEVTAYLEMRAREEAGHERLVLKDLRALGLPADQLVANLIPVGIKPLCDLFEYFCFQDYPIDSVGYSYCLERIAASKPKAEIDAVQALVPERVDITRFLRSHSSLGSEVAHVEETIEFVSELPADDRTRVVQAVYRSASVMAEAWCLESAKSEAEICQELEQAAGQQLHLLERQPAESLRAPA